MQPRSDDEKLYYEYVLVKIGQNLRAARTALGLTSTEAGHLIAEAAGRTVAAGASYYRALETGRREISLCRALLIANVLGMTPAQLFKDVPSASQLRDRSR